MIVVILFILAAAGTAFAYLRSRGRYNDYLEPLDTQKYPLKALMPAALYLLDKSRYKYQTKYDKKIQDKISEYYGPKYCRYYLQVHWANKISFILVGLLVVLFIGGIMGLQQKQPVKAEEVKIEKDGKIQRPRFGEGNKQVNLNAKIQKGKEEMVEQFEVPLKEMSPETEDEKAVSSARELLNESVIKGKNTDLQNVKEDLILPGDDKGFGDKGVSIIWKTASEALITSDGKIHRPEYGAGNKTLRIKAILTRGNCKPVEKYFKVTVLQSETPKTDKQSVHSAREELGKLLDGKSEDMNGGAGKIQLPLELKNIPGLRVQWFHATAGKDHTAFIFILFGISVLGAVIYAFDRELDKKISKKRLMIQLEFPDFLNKLTLLINAGMTVGRAWEKAVADSKKGTPLYEELNLTLLDIRAGKPESQAYEEFSKRCKIPEVTKFVSVVLQNIKKGNSELVSVLKFQSYDCWEMRKNASKKLGEEASTKMLLPMMIMFIAILIIVAVPAVLSLQGI